MPSNFLRFSDISPTDIKPTIQRAIEIKSGNHGKSLAGKAAVLLFEKPSLRTKLSFWVGIEKLGGKPVYFGPDEVGLGKREPVADVARVVSRMAEIVIIRTFAQAVLDEFAAAGTIPVVNALSDFEHPCQALADLQTIYEHCGKLAGVRVAYIGDGNNVARSLAYAVAGSGGHLVIASPAGFELDRDSLAGASNYGAEMRGTVDQLRSPQDAVKGADIVYTDVWASMGQEAEADSRKAAFAGYQVNPELMALAGDGAKFMHDMPAHPGEEVSEGMLDHPSSIAFDQAENRLWAQAALVERLL
ncbi:MAG: ornithine carbamoyltransferase [Chloroflexi bacterium]|nr:ornithine carbamoyltransferase [Chloroflexota bacterium]